MDSAELDAQLRKLFEQQRVIEANIAAALAVADQRESYRIDGHRSTHAYVKATINCDGGQAARLVRRARTVNEHEIVGDAFTGARTARRTQHGDRAHEHSLPRTTQQRKFDAMHSIFMAYVTKPTGGPRPAPLVNIVIDAATAGDALHDHGLAGTPQVFSAAPASDDLTTRRCETSTGTVIHTDIALQAMLTGHVRRVVVDSAGVVTDTGRRRRLFSGQQREAAQMLVTTCAHSGCSVPAELCNVDHLTEWAERDGATDQANAGVLCRAHNRFKHQASLRARRAVDGRVRLIKPDGTVIKPVGERDPDWADESRTSAPTSVFDRVRVISWKDRLARHPDLVGHEHCNWTISSISFDDLVQR